MTKNANIVLRPFWAYFYYSTFNLFGGSAAPHQTRHRLKAYTNISAHFSVKKTYILPIALSIFFLVVSRLSERSK